MMTPEKWENLKAIYHAASELEKTEREEFLQKVCFDDAEMLREARAMLAATDHEFLQEDVFGIGMKILGNENTETKMTEIQNSVPNLIGGRYEIVRRLAEGGIGEVYLANDIKLQNNVVVKFLQSGMSSNWIIEKFRDEAVVQSRVSHPNVAKALDKDVLPNGKFYLVMEFIEGLSIAEIIKQAKFDDQQIPLEVIAEIIKQTSRGVNAVHESSLVHRDLKPANLMIEQKINRIPVTTDEIIVKVIDFGIVRDLTKGTALNPVGTFSYMPFEQLNGQDVSPAADVFALGVIAYQLVTLNLPFNIKSTGNPNLDVVSHLRSRQENVKVLPSALRPDLPQEAETLILQALDAEMTKRPQSAKKFGDELAKALTKETPQPPPSSKKMFILATAFVLVAAILGAMWMWNPFGGRLTRLQVVTVALESDKPNANGGGYDKEPSYPVGTPPPGMNFATVGFNLWRTRTATTRDADDTARETVEGEEVAAERIDDGGTVSIGEKFRFSIESLTENFLPNNGGYLYVINRERYADGTFGKAWLLFPNARTFNGENIIKTAQPVALPKSAIPYRLQRSPSRSDQVAETYTIIISPWKFWLPPLDAKRTELPPDLFADWEKQFSERAYRASLRGGVGKPRTKREQKIGSRETVEADESLTQNDPLPQTLLRTVVKNGNPAMFTVALKFKE